MSETTVVTTEWHSAFLYDNVDFRYHSGTLFPSSMTDYMIIRYDGNIYAISNDNIRYEETGIRLANGGSSIMYYPDTRTWGSDQASSLPLAAYENGVLLYENIEVMAQNISRSHMHYFTTEQFRSGDIYAPTGSMFDDIYTSDVLGGVVQLLPVVLVVLTGYLSIRKGIKFITSYLRAG